MAGQVIQFRRTLQLQQWQQGDAPNQEGCGFNSHPKFFAHGFPLGSLQSLIRLQFRLTGYSQDNLTKYMTKCVLSSN